MFERTPTLPTKRYSSSPSKPFASCSQNDEEHSSPRHSRAFPWPNRRNPFLKCPKTVTNGCCVVPFLAGNGRGTLHLPWVSKENKKMVGSGVWVSRALTGALQHPPNTSPSVVKQMAATFFFCPTFAKNASPVNASTELSKTIVALFVRVHCTRDLTPASMLCVWIELRLAMCLVRGLNCRRMFCENRSKVSLVMTLFESCSHVSWTARTT